MAKRVKTKKGSIGKKALAAILAASMVLSSSAFSVLAADGGITDVENPNDGIETVAYTDELPGNIGKLTISIKDQEYTGMPIDESKLGSSTNGSQPDKGEIALYNPDGHFIERGNYGYGRYWKYEVKKVERNVNIGGQSTQNGHYNVWPSVNDMEVNGYSGPYVVIHVQQMNPEGTAVYAEADIYAPFAIVPRYLDRTGKNPGTDELSGEWDWHNYVYNGTRQYPRFTDAEITPIETLNDNVQKTFDTFKISDSGDFDYVEVDSNGEATSSNDLTSAGIHYVNIVGKENGQVQGVANQKWKKQYEISPAKMSDSSISVSIDPVKSLSNNADLVKAIREATTVKDAYTGTELNDNEWALWFPDENEQFADHFEGAKENYPKKTEGDHKVRIYATKEAKNFEYGSWVECTYKILDNSEFQMLVDNGTFGGKKIKGGVEFTYSGSDLYPRKKNYDTDLVILADDGTQLTQGKDYEILDEDVWIDAGKYTLHLKGAGDYAGQEATIDVEVKRLEIADATKLKDDASNKFTMSIWQGLHQNDAETSDVNKKYDKVLVEMERTIKGTNGGDVITLVEDTDYKITTKTDNITEKLLELKVEGIGNYAGSLTISKFGDNCGDTTNAGAGSDTRDTVDDGIECYVSDYHMHLNSKSITKGIKQENTPIYWKEGGVQINKEMIQAIERCNGKADKELNKNASTSTGFDLVIPDGAGDGYTVSRTSGDAENNVATINRAGETYIKIRGSSSNKYSANGGFGEVLVNVLGTDFNQAFYADAKDYNYTGTAVQIEDPKVYDKETKAQFTAVTYEYYDSNGRQVNIKDGGDVKNPIVLGGTYTVVIKPDYTKNEAKRFSGEIRETFEVKATDIGEAATVTVSPESYVYDGKEHKPAVTVTLKNGVTTLSEGIHFTVSDWGDNVNAGTATVTVTGKGSYSGTATGTFTITPASIAGATVTAENQAYSENPAVTVVVDGNPLTQGTDYTVSCTPSEDGKTATVTVTGTGNYTGTAAQTATFEIVESGSDEPEPTPPVEETIKTPTITLSRNISKTKKTFTVTTCKVPGATKWEVQYSLKDTFKANGDLQSCKTKTVTKANRLKQQVIKCNKSGKRYYVRVRAWVGDQHSAWSDTADPDGLESIKSR